MPIDLYAPLSHAECIPPCINGTCNMISGECECSDGFTGSDCSSGNQGTMLHKIRFMVSDITRAACPGGMYGAGCLQNCTCVVEHGSSPCDNVDGTCHCLPGYNGSSCETGTSTLQKVDGYFDKN